MYLVLAEKPSVAQALANVLGAASRKDGYLEGNGAVVSWCLGHLAEYEPPEAYGEQYRKWEFSDLPIVPGTWRLSVAKEKKKQFEVLKKLLNRSNFAYVVNGCDAGREGELIFKRVYDLSGSRLPVKRLWISSMEDAAIRDGFSHLRDGAEYENLCRASVCRAQADWLVGMNATRAFTTKYFKKLTVGRVQTPTLAMLAERQEAIQNFRKEAYFRAALTGFGMKVVSADIKDEAECDALVERCQGMDAVVSKVEKLKQRSAPPKLYDLTTLQREANRFFGYTAQETLKELQELYEAKLVTYPRTDSQYVTEDMGQTVMELLEALPQAFPFLPAASVGRDIGRITNNAKVSDHHALLPTKAALGRDLDGLPAKQKNILAMVAQRLAQAVSGDCLYEETKVEVLCGGSKFTAKGRTIEQPGFRQIETAFKAAFQKGETEKKDGRDIIPDGLYEAMTMRHVRAEKETHFTSPPKPYTEDTLLSAMETAGNQEFDRETEKKGLGTPATRAAILEKLVSSGYAVRKGKQLLPTEDGMVLISVMPEYLRSAEMTAEWENKLLLMEKGLLGGEDFLQGILDMIGRMLDDLTGISPQEQGRFHPKEEIGTCPACHSPVYEGKKNFYCSNRDCAFSLWKENRYLSGMRKQIDKRMAQDLLSSGRTHVTDFYSQKTGKNFTADLLMEVSDGRANFKLEFPQRKSRKTGYGNKE